MSKEENIERLYQILRFDDNWNGYGAKPIPLDVIHKTKILINSFIIQPSIYPTGNESIQLEWENDDYYFEVNIHSNIDKLDYLLEDKTKDTILNNSSDTDDIYLNNDPNDINRYLIKYFKDEGVNNSYA